MCLIQQSNSSISRLKDKIQHKGMASCLYISP